MSFDGMMFSLQPSHWLRGTPFTEPRDSSALTFNFNCEQPIKMTLSEHQNSGGSLAGTSELKPSQASTSRDYRKAAGAIRGAITKAFSSAYKYVKDSEVAVDRPLASRTVKELEAIDDLRKKMMAAHSMLVNDDHFLEKAKEKASLLPEEELEMLLTIVPDKFAEKKDRKAIVDNLTARIVVLQAFFKDHGYPYNDGLAPTEMKAISEVMDDPIDEEDEKVAEDLKLDDLFLQSFGEDPEKDHDDGNTDVIPPVVITPTTENTVVPATTIQPPLSVPGDGASASAQTVVRQPPISLLNKKEEYKQAPLLFINKGRASSAKPTKAEAESCPVCKADHPIAICEHPRREIFLSYKGWCAICGNNEHKAADCQVRIAVPSPVPSMNGGRFMETTTPVNYSTPHTIAPRNTLYNSNQDEEDRMEMSLATQKGRSKARFSQESSDDEEESRREHNRSRRNGTRKGLSFYDAEAVVPEFNGDPIKYKMFSNMFQDQVMDNERLSDSLKWSLLEKKLVGKAKNFVVALTNPVDAIRLTLRELENQFNEEHSVITEALSRFRQIKFTDTDYSKATMDLMKCKSLIMRLRELGEDVDSPSFVRMLVEKLPERVMRLMRSLYKNNGRPTTDEVIQKYMDFLNDRTFCSKFVTVDASKRTKEIPVESAMIVENSNRSSDNNGQKQAGKSPQPNGKANAMKPVGQSSKNSSNNKMNSNKTKGGNNPQPAKPTSQPRGQGNQQSRQRNNSGNASSQFTQDRKFGNQKYMSQQNLQNPSRTLADDDEDMVPMGAVGQNNGATPNPQIRGIPGENLEPCYKFGRGYDVRFIAHTFPRSTPTANKCCFMCGPGHSILQCSKSSYEVRQFLRQSKSCHNCAKQDHITEHCSSLSSCAYCRGFHNTGACRLKEYYRDLNNYPAEAPAPILDTDGTGFKEPQVPNAVLSPAFPRGPPDPLENLLDQDIQIIGDKKSQVQSPIPCTGDLPSFLKSLGAESLHNASLLGDSDETHKLPFVALRTSNGRTILCLADTGASISILSHESAERHGFQVLASRKLTISGYSKTTTEDSNIYQLSLESADGPFIVTVAGAPRLPKTKFMCPRLSAQDMSFLGDRNFEAKDILKDRFFNGRSIDMILGNDLLSRLLGSSQRVLLPSLRYIEFTECAPIIFPPPRSSPVPTTPSIESSDDSLQPSEFINMLSTPSNNSRSELDLVREIAQLWNLENIGIEQPAPIENGKTNVRDLLAEFEKNIRYDADGNLMVSLPWNGKQKRLANNRGMALKRLEQQQSSGKKNEELMKEYDKTFRTQLASGIIEEVTKDMNNTTGPIYFIPHKAVLKLASLTTKLRIVFDGSSKRNGELSLNDCLEPGPSMLVDLYDILIRSRLPNNLVVADIEKAFHQVRLNPEDRNCTRFLWFKDPSLPATRDNIIEYRSTRIPFGLTCSPFLLLATIDHFLRKLNTPITSRIRENLYVDNVMITSNQKEEIQSIRSDCKTSFEYMNMNLREFTTNCQDEMAKFPPGDIASESTIKLLGYLWDTIQDTYTIKLATLSEKVPTKRQVASRMAETFDPLGLLAPLLVQFKLLMSDLWDDGITWKSTVPAALLPRWEMIRKQFSESSITVPRLLRSRERYSKFHLMVFADASKDTYACAVYILYEYDFGPPEVGLLTAKSKIKPAGCHTLTIPRLELLAIEIGSRLVMTIEKAMNCERPASIRFFSDSMVALYWILRGEQKKCWVQNRVKAIHENIEKAKSLGLDTSLHHCPTDQNPADIATRGMGSKELKNCSLWFQGPEFLKKDPKDWPCRLEGDISCPSDFHALVSAELITKKVRKSTGTDPEETSKLDYPAFANTINGMCMTVKKEDEEKKKKPYRSFVPFGRSNSLAKVVSHTHSVLSCLLKLFPGKKWESPTMVAFQGSQVPRSELETAMTRRAIARRLVFQEHYKESEDKGWTFEAELNPTQGEDGLWRTRRRVPSPVLENECNELILIHKKHELARLLVEETHTYNVHLPATYLVASLRTRYWIAADRKLAETVVRGCISCQKVNNKTLEYPYSKNLRFRTTPSIPFQYVGLDYMGPLSYLRDDGQTAKSYVLVYTCLVTRATHLELLPDNTAEVYVLGLKNIFSRRGVPKSIYSDNARTFILGAKIIKDSMSRYKPSMSLTCFLAHHEIDFHFITPLAPWQGGIYERVVGVVKHQLIKEMGKSRLSFFNLNNVLIRVENMINSRPLTPNPRQIHDLPALRPMDFLLPTVLIDIPTRQDGEESEEDFDPSRNPTITERRTLAHLEGINEVLERLWDIWSAAYLSFLQSMCRKKKRSSKLVPRIGQVVLIQTEKLARHNWPIGVIEAMKTGADGQIRSVEVRCRDGVYNRAVNQIVPLEIYSKDHVYSDANEETEERPTASKECSPVRKDTSKRPSASQGSAPEHSETSQRPTEPPRSSLDSIESQARPTASESCVPELWDTSNRPTASRSYSSVRKDTSQRPSASMGCAPEHSDVALRPTASMDSTPVYKDTSRSAIVSNDAIHEHGESSQRSTASKSCPPVRKDTSQRTTASMRCAPVHSEAPQRPTASKSCPPVHKDTSQRTTASMGCAPVHSEVPQRPTASKEDAPVHKDTSKRPSASRIPAPVQNKLSTDSLAPPAIATFPLYSRSRHNNKSHKVDNRSNRKVEQTGNDVGLSTEKSKASCAEPEVGKNQEASQMTDAPSNPCDRQTDTLATRAEQMLPGPSLSRVRTNRGRRRNAKKKGLRSEDTTVSKEMDQISERVRSYLPRSAKNKNIDYACIAMPSEPQTPRSVNSILYPEQKAIALQHQM